MENCIFIVEHSFSYIDDIGVTHHHTPEIWENSYFSKFDDAILYVKIFLKGLKNVESVNTAREKRCLKKWRYDSILNNGIKTTQIISIYKMEIINPFAKK